MLGTTSEMGSKLRSLRNNLGIRQLDMARALEVSQQKISDLEMGSQALTEEKLGEIKKFFALREASHSLLPLKIPVPCLKGTTSEMGARLRKLRQIVGYKQSDLAEVLGVEQQHVLELETGKRELTEDRFKEIKTLLKDCFERLPNKALIEKV